MFPHGFILSHEPQEAFQLSGHWDAILNPNMTTKVPNPGNHWSEGFTNMLGVMGSGLEVASKFFRRRPAVVVALGPGPMDPLGPKAHAQWAPGTLGPGPMGLGPKSNKS